jgi:Sulfatase
VGLLLEDMASVSMKARGLLTCGLVVVGALAGWVALRWPRWWPWLAAVGGVAALAIAELVVPPREKPWLRLALDVVACGSLATACAAFLAHHKPRMAAGRSSVIASLAVLPLAGFGALFAVSGVRAYVYEFAPHAQAFVAPLHLPTPKLANGDVVCKGPAQALAKRPRSSASGVAKGADILMLSFDAMRHDQAHAVPQVWKSLGPHVKFTRAVTPAPRTMSSFSAMLRGVPLRQVAFDGRAPSESVARGAPPTLAKLLVKLGYRAVQVPTHRYFGADKKMNAGFELALTRSFATTREREHDGGAYNIVPAHDAFEKALDVAERTKKPLLLWVHLMEGHEPYRWNGGRGPATKAGQQHAFADLDAPSAQFIERFRALRSGRPVVVAVFGDHGEEFQEHGGKYHSTSVHAEQVHAALALQAPGLSQTRIDAPVSHAALPATLFDLLGLPAPPTFSEPSLLACIDSKRACPDVAVSQMNAFGRAIGYTFERYRLLVDPRNGVEQVFDSDHDPFEERNLAAVQPALLQSLRERAKRFDEERCVQRKSMR